MRYLGFAFAVAAIALGVVVAAGSSTPGPVGRGRGTVASSTFWSTWGDGKAELSGYRITTSRYGAARTGKVVLIYVTEPMDKKVWIKDDAGDVPAADRVNVLKLNHVLEFQTGIYRYAVMTSVFAPVDGGGPERFAPAKLTLTAQEWCGQVWQKVMPARDRFESELRSYFHADGERNDATSVPPGTLYQDALLIQLRELDGPFSGGRDWSGTIVPTLWGARKSHRPLAPVPATIARAKATRDGVPVTRFTLAAGDVTTTYDVETAAPRRVLGWRSSDGEDARILKTTRLPYWKLNAPGDEAHLAELGF